MNLGFVGGGDDKFTPEQVEIVKGFIVHRLISESADTVVSGHSPVGGVDIWAEEAATSPLLMAPIKPLIFVPTTRQWDPPNGYGYKARNLDIARHSDILYIIVAAEYPPGYSARKFPLCYHCVRHPERPKHVKSGGCWTGNEAIKMGKTVIWVVI